MTQWFIAKYVPDLRRREPINVGVVLLPSQGRPLSRFRGQRPDGSIDGRKTTFAKEPAVYRGWIDHWTRMLGEATASEGGLSEKVLLSTPHLSTYYLERGGELLSGYAGDANALLNELFDLLVLTPPETAAEVERDEQSFRVLVQRKLESSPRIKRHLRRRYRIETDNEETFFFPFAYSNGHTTVARIRKSLNHQWARSTLYEKSQLPAVWDGKPVTGMVVLTLEPNSDDATTRRLETEAFVLDVEQSSVPDIEAAFIDTPKLTALSPPMALRERRELEAGPDKGNR